MVLLNSRNYSGITNLKRIFKVVDKKYIRIVIRPYNIREDIRITSRKNNKLFHRYYKRDVK
jgi:hypothetical protein